MTFEGTKKAKFVDISTELITTDTKTLNAFSWFCECIVKDSDKIPNAKDNYHSAYSKTIEHFDMDDADIMGFEEMVDKFAENRYKVVRLKGLEIYVYWWKHDSAPLFIVK